MAAFICDRCGKCCVSLGPSITIERQLNDRDYYCRSRIDNTIFVAHVDSAYREEIADEYTAEGDRQAGTEKKPCRFLRKDPEDAGNCCAIYATRPKVCQDFRCYRMLIRDREGHVCGRVIGKNILRTEDAALDNLWNKEVAAIPYGDTVTWSGRVAGILADHGYRTETVE